MSAPGAFFAPAVAQPGEMNKVLHIAYMHVGNPAELNKDTTYAFLGTNGTGQWVTSAIQALKAAYPDVKKVGVILADDGGIPFLTPIIQKGLADAGMQMAGSAIPFAADLQDFTSIAIKANQVSDAEAYLQPGGSTGSFANIIKQLRQLGNNKPYVTQVDAASILPIINSNSAATNLITRDCIIDAPGNPAILNDLMKQMAAKKYVTTYIEAASCLYTLANVMQEAQSVDPTEVRDYWETLTNGTYVVWRRIDGWRCSDLRNPESCRCLSRILSKDYGWQGNFHRVDSFITTALMKYNSEVGRYTRVPPHSVSFDAPDVRGEG